MIRNSAPGARKSPLSDGESAPKADRHYLDVERLIEQFVTCRAPLWARAAARGNRMCAARLWESLDVQPHYVRSRPIVPTPPGSASRRPQPEHPHPALILSSQLLICQRPTYTSRVLGPAPFIGMGTCAGNEDGTERETR